MRIWIRSPARLRTGVDEVVPAFLQVGFDYLIVAAVVRQIGLSPYVARSLGARAGIIRDVNRIKYCPLTIGKEIAD
jgi:hypothetical protein